MNPKNSTSLLEIIVGNLAVIAMTSTIVYGSF